jgi:hypothetical protein
LVQHFAAKGQLLLINIVFTLKVKGEVHHITYNDGMRGVRDIVILFLQPRRYMAKGGLFSGRLTPSNETEAFYRRVGRPVWMGEGNLAHTVIRPTDRSARSSSPYQLRYCDPLTL